MQERVQVHLLCWLLGGAQLQTLFEQVPCWLPGLGTLLQHQLHGMVLLLVRLPCLQ
jgi:hypothetical protein